MGLIDSVPLSLRSRTQGDKMQLTFIGEPTVIRYGLSSLSDTECTRIERPTLVWDRKKSGLNGCKLLVDNFSENIILVSKSVDVNLKGF